ncbi:MAG: YceD family protein [Verrucomicrobiota bacterium]
MPLTINLRHLEHNDLALKGELPAVDLELEQVDELIHAANPLHYELTVQRLDDNLLVQGDLSLTVEFECARCLKSFSRKLEFKNWSVHLPLAGEDKAEVLGDCVDLTPYIREDILLAFPQHPLCERECGGLKTKPSNRAKSSNGAKQMEESSAWAELNKLKL